MPFPEFPQWIDKQKKKEQRASMRLKYMLSLASLRRYGRASMHALAAEAKCDHSSIFNAISRGYFTKEMAVKIEKVVGRDELPSDWLMHPLDVEKLPV